jgi:cystathionine beta-synthase
MEKITHLIACSGTGGTISGTAKFLKSKILILKFWLLMLLVHYKKYHETKNSIRMKFIHTELKV